MHQPSAAAPVLAAPTTLARRALIAGASGLAEALRRVEPTDGTQQKALERWFADFAAQVRSHLELVDTLVVPALAARGALEARDLDTIADDHAWTDELLGELGDALGVLSFGLGAEHWWLGKAADLAGSLEHVLTGQLTREDVLLSALVARGSPRRSAAGRRRGQDASSDVQGALAAHARSPAETRTGSAQSG